MIKNNAHLRIGDYINFQFFLEKLVHYSNDEEISEYLNQNRGVLPRKLHANNAEITYYIKMLKKDYGISSSRNVLSYQLIADVVNVISNKSGDENEVSPETVRKT